MLYNIANPLGGLYPAHPVACLNFGPLHLFRALKFAETQVLMF